MKGARAMRPAFLVFSSMATALLAASGQADSPGQAAGSAVLLRVVGEGLRSLELSTDAFAKLPRQSVRAKDHENKEGDFAGVALVDVLKAAGVKFGNDLRGTALASYLIVEAADGYRAVFALPEIDPASTDRVILLADRRDGKPLSASEGPLRVIVPGEKRHSRWVRQVIVLRVGRG
jgi:DMSO/TMAO reductase YedYZ molybdopterin-dependent catalytic subunit